MIIKNLDLEKVPVESEDVFQTLAHFAPTVIVPVEEDENEMRSAMVSPEQSMVDQHDTPEEQEET